MGVRIAHDRKQGIAILYCSTSDFAFGPVFYDGPDHRFYGKQADERAEAFCRWFRAHEGTDPRLLTDSELERAYSTWLAQEAAQWAAEARAERAADACEFTQRNPHEWFCTTHEQLCIGSTLEPVMCPIGAEHG